MPSMVCFNDQLLKQKFTDKILKFTNCKIFYGDRKGLHDTELWVLNGKIIDPKVVLFELKRKADIIIDCQGLIISPGFIDIQVNGAFGVDFSSESISCADIELVGKGLLQYGVTAYCPTLISSKSNVYEASLSKIANCMRSPNEQSPKILGAHLEGPFISYEKCGCHPTENLSEFVDPTASDKNKANEVVDSLERVYGKLDSDVVSLVTLAPELPGAMTAISHLTKTKGIRVSIGHSKASLEIGAAALRAGANCITHMFNAMSSFHHRKSGIIGLLTNRYDENSTPFYYGIIADGIHVSKESLRLAHSIHFDGLILVTDCISALGLQNGIHRLGKLEVEVVNMKATVRGSSTVAGSVATMPYCINTLMETTNCGLDEALQCATWKPACVLGIKIGSLRPGSCADLVLLRHDVKNQIEVAAVFIDGLYVF